MCPSWGHFISSAPLCASLHTRGWFLAHLRFSSIMCFHWRGLWLRLARCVWLLTWWHPVSSCNVFNIVAELAVCWMRPFQHCRIPFAWHCPKTRATALVAHAQRRSHLLPLSRHNIYYCCDNMKMAWLVRCGCYCLNIHNFPLNGSSLWLCFRSFHGIRLIYFPLGLLPDT